MSIEVRPASEIANEICGCSTKDQHRRDVALIEADRQQAVAAEVAQIVAWLRDDNVYCWTDQEIAEAIERGEYKETNK